MALESNMRLGRVHYELQGEGAPIVMLHGSPGDIGYMKGLMEPIFERRSDWQRIYFDLPGNGHTRATEAVDSYDRELEFVLEFIDRQLDGRRFAITGYSYGGYLARGVVHQRPDQVGGLCLVAPRIMQDRTQKTVPEHVTLVPEPGFSQLLKDGEEWIPDHLVVQSREGLEAMRKHVLPCLALYDESRDWIYEATSGLSFDVDDLAAPFEHPALIVTGRQDSITGYQDGWPLLGIYPRATYVVLDQAGHFVGLAEQTSLFKALVHDWLDRLAGQGWLLAREGDS